MMGGSTGSSEVFCFWPGTFLPFGGEDTAAKGILKSGPTDYVFIETCFVLGNMPDVGDKMVSRQTLCLSLLSLEPSMYDKL